MTEPRTYVGLDVSMEWLDLAHWPVDQIKPWRVPNTKAGWKKLIAHLATLANPLLVLEATGAYHRGVVGAVDAAGYQWAVINPAHISNFRKSQGKRAKTDRVDALLIAQYGVQTTPAPTPLPSAPERALQAWVNRRADLVKDQVRELNRRQQIAESGIQASINRHLAMIKAESNQINQEIARVIAADAALRTRTALIDTAPGIGPVLAAAIIAGLPELGHTSTAKLKALVGVAPFARDSGKTEGQRFISGGREAVRKALYQAVTAGLRCNPVLRAHVDKLKANKKAHKVAMVAAMSRMVGILNAMLRDGLTWQQTDVGQGLFLG